MKNVNYYRGSVFNLAQLMFVIALASCNNGSKSNNNTNTNPQISGIVYGFQTIGSQNCNFVNNSSYSCSETSLNGTIVTTQIITFNSQQELCNNLRNDNLHNVSTGYGQVPIAQSVRNQYVSMNCTAYPSNIGNNGTILTDPNLFRSMTCSMRVEAFDGAYGDLGELQVPITASGMRGNVFTNMVKERKKWIFNVVTNWSSSRYLKVRYIFSKGDGVRGEQLTLVADVKNGPLVEITGFAGGEGVSLNIENAGDVIRAEINCKVTDANNAGTLSSNSDYKCNVSGNDDVEKSTLSMPVSELINNTLTFTTEEAKNTVTMSPEGSYSLRAGSAVYSGRRNLSQSSSLMNVQGRANLNTASQFKYQYGSKKVDVRCK
jgi:hypothetical protein